MRRFDIYIENDKLDLFDDETVSVNSSVQNINDISKTFTDFTPSITIPATNRNNRIVKHWYDADIVNGFDGRALVKGRVEIGTLPYRIGLIRLTGAKLKDGKVQDYTITFFGNLANLSQIFSEDEMKTIDLSDCDHQFTSANVLTGLQSGLFSGNLVYPLISSVKRWFYNSLTSDHTTTDKLVNIARHTGHSSGQKHGIVFDELKPAVKVGKIIQAIQDTYGITFTGTGLSRAQVSSLYLWLSREKGNISALFEGDITTQITNFDTLTKNFDLVSLQGSYIAIEDPGFPFYFFDIRATSTDTLLYTIGLYRNDVLVDSRQSTGNISWQATGISSGQLLGATWKLKITSKANKVLTSADFELFASAGNLIFDLAKTTNFVVTSTILLETSVLTPKLKVKDFLSGLIKMFNLAIVPENETTFFIEPLSEWYVSGKTTDITKYVDTSEQTIERGKLLNEIKFNYKEGKTFLYKEFQDRFKRNFGDLELEIKDEKGKLIDGESKTLQLPFEMMIYERLTDQNTGTLTNIQYGYATDDKGDPVKVEPHLFYAIQKNISASPITVIDDAGNEVNVNGNVFVPAYSLNTTTKAESTLFGLEFDSWDGQNLSNSLFELFYKDYITSIFDIRRRIYKQKAILPLHILLSINLNDTLIINNRAFLVNSMDANLNNNETTFELINKL